MLFTLCLLLLFAAGCLTTEGPTEVKETDDSPEVSADDTTETTDALGLSVDEAVELVDTAQQTFFYISSGGSNFVYESFEFEGLPYRYLGESIDSWEKLRSLLGPIYTPEASDLFIEYLAIIEHEGRLAQPDGDGGSIVDWTTAEVELIEGGEEEIAYDFTVSYNSYTETVSFTFVLTEDGWRLNYPLLY